MYLGTAPLWQDNRIIVCAELGTQPWRNTFALVISAGPLDPIQAEGDCETPGSVDSCAQHLNKLSYLRSKSSQAW